MFELDRIRARDLPPASIGVGVLTLILFAVELWLGGADDLDVLVRLGASSHALVFQKHQLHRLVCPAFLHGGVLHIALNGYAFVQLAPFVEKVWGSARFLIVYFVCAVGGSLASSFFGQHGISVGASGAIFGLCGFLIAAAYTGSQKHEVRTLVRTIAGQSLLFWVVVNVAYGFSLGRGMGIDNYAHLGGLVTGALMGFVVTEVDEPDGTTRGAAVLAVLLVVASFALCFARSHKDLRTLERRANELLEKGEFLAAASVYGELLGELGTDYGPEAVADIRGRQGRAYENAGKLDEAEVCFSSAYEHAPQAALASELAELALERNDPRRALEWAERGVRDDPARATELADVTSRARAQLETRK